MSPKEARVFVVEDDPEWQELIGLLLSNAGHQVVLRATTKQDALTAVQGLKMADIQIATIDGNLSERGKGEEDGRAVLEAIREHAPYVKTIGLATFEIPGADVNLRKKDTRRLPKLITDL